MFKFRFLTCLAALGLLATACTTELVDPNENLDEIILEGVSCVPEIGQDLIHPDAKTVMDESVTSGWKTLWEPREYIGVYGNRTKNARFRTTNYSNTAAPGYSGSVTYGDTPKYTYYPYSSANGRSSYTAVKHSLPLSQDFDTADRSLACDFKIGSVTTSGSSWRRTYTFTWDVMPLTFLRVKINAEGSSFVGEKVQSVTMKVPQGRRLGGDFTANLSAKTISWTTGTDGYNEMTLNLTDEPALTSSGILTAYMTCAPAGIQKGDVVEFTITTNKHVLKTTKTINATIAANYIYGLSFNLASSDFDSEGIPVDGLDFESFSFSVANNQNKILAKELYYDSNYSLTGGYTGATTSRSVTSKSMTVNKESKTVTGCIPYLHDFTLVPTFTLTDRNAKVLVAGEEVVSGQTPVTFANGQPVTFEIASDAGSNYYEVTLSNTGLPVVVLQSNGKGTVNWRQAGLNVTAKSADWNEDEYLSIYNADGSVSADNLLCGFKLRGNSTRKYPKKPFAIKLGSKANLLNIMPEGKHKRWCLLANWSDHSLMRNALTFAAANRTVQAWENAGIPQGLIWNPSGKNVELVIDGVHLGNYLLCEQIKIDEYRLDIKDPYEDVPNASFADCGYLLEFDDNYDETYKFQTTYRKLPAMFKDDVDDSSIRSQVQSRVNNIETYLRNGNYSAAFELLDIYSVIDWWFIHELAMNKEYRHPKSVYMYMDGDGKLCAGPVWDFDYQTYPNISNVNSIHSSAGQSGFGYTASQWLYSGSNSSDPYMWYPLLFKSADFRNAVKERWQTMKPALSAAVADIAEMGQANKVSWEYNFAMWPIESGERSRRYVANLPDVSGVTYDSWFIEYCGDERMTDYDQVVANLQNVYTSRIAEMDSMITSGNFVTNAQ